MIKRYALSLRPSSSSSNWEASSLNISASYFNLYNYALKFYQKIAAFKIGSTTPITMEEIIIIQSRFENLNIVWKIKPKIRIINTIIICANSTPKANSKSGMNLLSDFPIRILK